MKKKISFLIPALIIITFIYFYTKNNNTLANDLAQPTLKKEDVQLTPLKSDTRRYLAHAGGEINGQRHTNSLKAINLNYSLGFRIFEIDIITTSDGHLVCAHDWDSWKRFTRYTGETPVSLDEFLKHKIKRNYTPLSLEMLHEWFKNHPDATLFTDKINDPIAVSRVFTRKSQLMIKVTSIPALKIAKSLDIEFVVAENILNSFKTDKLQKLQDLEVKHILISRKSIPEKKDLLLKIKKAEMNHYGLKVHSFGLVT